ncbi:MAG TPA: sialidase family protein [Kofleriaceae bacterium]|nr:sialidase family protein [Kofleriaceae bacterium]
MTSPPREPVDVRGLAGTREVVVCEDGGLFPVLATAGDEVIGILRGGAGHVGRSGRLELVRSRGGQTWSPPVVVADSDRDDRNAALGRLASGALVLAYQRQGAYDRDGVYRPDLRDADGERPAEVVVTRSTDGGRSWAAPVPLGVAALAAGSPYGKIVCLADGGLLLAIYDPWAEGGAASHVVRSTDDGRTWGDPTLVARGMNETALLAWDDRVLAVLRGADRAQALFAASSIDGGRTWSSAEPVAPARHHPGDLALLATGDVLLTYGNRAGPYRIEGLLSRDRGATWGDRLLALSGDLYEPGAPAGRVTDFGYPSTAAAGDGRAVTMYYVNPSLPAEVDGDPPHLRPPYRADGYRAIAISWSEDELVRAARGS